MLDRRSFLLSMLGAGGALVLTGCDDTIKMAQGKSAIALESALKMFERDAEQLRKGMPDGAKELGKRMPSDPFGSRLELQTAIHMSRESVNQLGYAKSTFFAFVAPDGKVLRSEIDPDRLVEQDLLSVYPGLKKALEPNSGLVEAYGEMDALRAVIEGNDTAWVVAHRVEGTDGKAAGLFVSGWSMRYYAGFVQDALRIEMNEKTANESKKVELYFFILKGSGAFGHTEAPDIHAKELLKLDIVGKKASNYRGSYELDDKKWGVAATMTPVFGDDAAAAVVSTLY